MDSWKEYVFSLILCTLGCAIVLQIVSGTRQKQLIRLVCGVVLIIFVLRPLVRLDVEALFSLPQWDQSAAEHYIGEGKKTASEARERYIKTACEAYILDKAKTMHVDLTANVFLNEALIPVSVEMEGDADRNVQMQLEKILTEDLGIPKENQTWIWNLESSTS